MKIKPIQLFLKKKEKQQKNINRKKTEKHAAKYTNQKHKIWPIMSCLIISQTASAVKLYDSKCCK